MNSYYIVDSTKEEEDLIWKGIIEYNSAVISLKQGVPFVSSGVSNKTCSSLYKGSEPL